jgi:hypothetical protein
VRYNFSGNLLSMKGYPSHYQPTVTIDTRKPHSVLRRLGNGDPDDRWIYTPSRTWIERHDGSIVVEREKPREAFADHTRMTPWDELHLTYFVGYAMWNYLATPFCFTMPGFVTRELDSHTENGQIWRVLEVTFPDSIPTHCKAQKFYYDDNFMLRRMDYTADVVKGVASHYCWDHKEFGGIVFPTLRRVIRRDPETDRPILEGPTSFSLDYCSVEVRP